MWFDLAWTSLEYCADVFYLPDTDENWAVVLRREGERFLVTVSRNYAYEGEWDLWDFFPGSRPPDGPARAYRLDGSFWPPTSGRALEQHYNFAHPVHAFYDQAMVGPFGVRLRDPKTDRDGPKNCPITLWLNETEAPPEPAP